MKNEKWKKKTFYHNIIMHILRSISVFNDMYPIINLAIKKIIILITT